MSIEGIWRGKLVGESNSGLIEVNFTQNGNDIGGDAEITEDDVGRYSYQVEGLIQGGNNLALSLTPLVNQTTAKLGKVTVTGVIHEGRTIKGNWRSTIGTQGAFSLKQESENEHAQESYDLDELLESLDIIREKDITSDELGTINGFHSAEEIKNKYCDYLTELLKNGRVYRDLINNVLFNESLKITVESGKLITRTLSKIESLITSGIHNPDFPGRRKDYIDQLGKIYQNIQKDLIPFQQQIRLAKLETTIVDEDYISHFKKNISDYNEQANDLLQEAQKAKEEVLKILHSAQDVTVEKGVKEGSSHFGTLCSSHKNFEYFWAISILISVGLLIWSVHFAYNIQTPETLTTQNILELFKRLALISIPLVLLKLSLTKYNAERNLRILYAHREKVLEQYKSFEAGIGNDTEAKNTFRLEVARYIFSDPKSNYAGSSESSSTGININPVTSVIERIASPK